MRIETYAISRVGSRAHQDDSVGDADLVAGRCAVIADGAGGHRGGAIASKVATEAILLNLATRVRKNGSRAPRLRVTFCDQSTRSQL